MPTDHLYHHRAAARPYLSTDGVTFPARTALREIRTTGLLGILSEPGFEHRPTHGRAVVERAVGDKGPAR